MLTVYSLDAEGVEEATVYEGYKKILIMHNYFIFINYSFHGFKYVLCLQMIRVLHHKGDELCLSVTLNLGKGGHDSHLLSALP